MLAPGIFRRIFEGHIPTGKDAPTNAPASPYGEIPAPQPQAPKSEAAAPSHSDVLNTPQSQASAPSPRPSPN
jgi:hypothetical protein